MEVVCTAERARKRTRHRQRKCVFPLYSKFPFIIKYLDRGKDRGNQTGNQGFMLVPSFPLSLEQGRFCGYDNRR